MEIIEKNDSVRFSIRVLPGASRSQIIGALDGALKVKIAAPPVDGAANTELVRTLAKWLSISKSDIEIISGQTSRNKRVRIAGVTPGQVEAALNAKS